MIDADHFKKINDTLGHAAGDAALVAIAETLSRTLGTQGLVARYGGEEFVCAIPDAPRVQVQSILEAIRAAIAAIELEFEGNQISLSVSIGCSTNTQISFNTVLSDADAAVYEAKAAGRNRVVIVD